MADRWWWAKGDEGNWHKFPAATEAHTGVCGADVSRLTTLSEPPRHACPDCQEADA